MDYLARTRSRFPALPEPELEPITKGGSDRRYFRLRFGDGASVPTMVLMHYTDARPDNLAFVPVTEFLARRQIAVPRIHAHDASNKLVWLEDLGGDDLWTYRDAPWEVRAPLYRQALDVAGRIHAIPEAEADIALQPPFDAALYQWEQNYFFEEFLGRYSTRPARDIAALRGARQWDELVEALVALPRFLVHRDFQSQNILVQPDRVALIDYQGLRGGRPEYDIASLLWDPYVPFSESERTELLAPHQGETLHRCAIQRLLQALGAYGRLSEELGKTGFRAHIPRALENLAAVMRQSGIGDNLLPFLEADVLDIPA